MTDQLFGQGLTLSILRNIERRADQVSKSTERLSTGLNINSPSEDSAGVALSLKLSSQSGIADKAVGNVNEGISIANIASDALDALETVNLRQQELVTTATETGLTGAQRDSIQAELDDLSTEWNRIISSAEYNNVQIFSATGSDISIQTSLTSGSQSIDLPFGEFINSSLNEVVGAASSPIVDTPANAEIALDLLESNYGAIVREGGRLSGAIDRLGTALDNLTATRDTLDGASKIILAVDVARESSIQLSEQITAEGSSAVLAQASNLEPSVVAALLGDDPAPSASITPLTPALDTDVSTSTSSTPPELTSSESSNNPLANLTLHIKE